VSHRLCYSALFILLLSASAFAQTERRPEFFVGYSILQAEGMPNRGDADFFNNNFTTHRGTLHGVSGEVMVYPLEASLIGLTGNISFNREKRSAEAASVSNSETTNVWHFLGGPSYVFPDQGRLVPLVRVLAGIARTGYEAAIERSVANGTLKSTFDGGTTDFAMAFGAGLEVRVNDRFKVRIIQVDYAPIFMGDRSVAFLNQAGVLQSRVLEGKRQDNFRFSFGVTF
jgi:opacity protein-like surface antigen